MTNNVADFPADVLGAHCVDIQTPDQFIVNQLTLHPMQALGALRQMRLRWNNPAHTAQTLAHLFEARGMPPTSLHLLERLEAL